jgi:hypothetical protein
MRRSSDPDARMSPAADRAWRRSATALRRSSEPALAVYCLLSGRSRELPWRRMLAVNSGPLRSGSGAGAHLGPPRAAARVALSALAGPRGNGADRASRPARALIMSSAAWSLLPPPRTIGSSPWLRFPRTPGPFATNIAGGPNPVHVGGGVRVVGSTGEGLDARSPLVMSLQRQGHDEEPTRIVRAASGTLRAM